VYAASFGSTGPDALRPAFDAVISAMAGGEVLQAGAGNPPQQRQTTDHSALLGVAVAILLGLRARDQTGEPQDIETTMVASAAYLFSDDFIRYAGKPERLVPDAGQHGLHALYRLYHAAEDGWLFLACTRDAEWQRLCGGLGRPELATDVRFSTAAARTTNDAALTTALGDAFIQRPAKGRDGWEAILTAVGVACVDAAGTWPELLFDDDRHATAQRIGEFHHPQLGRVEQVGAAIDLSDSAAPLRVPEPFAASTEALLLEVGYAAEEIERLTECGAVVVAADEREPEH
ncbi:MAG: hypothetical protein QOE63_980, partial [Acidimicrobiaceae bacterium]